MNLSQPRYSDQQEKQTNFDTPANEALMWHTLVKLAEAGVHAFATSGTLLGLVREGRLLAFDKDNDFRPTQQRTSGSA